jgi:hypothetical protein
MLEQTQFYCFLLFSNRKIFIIFKQLYDAYDVILPCLMLVESISFREIQVNIVNFYGKSLCYGCSYIYQSMPRLLSIWLDFGMSLSEMEKDKNKTRAKLDIMTVMKTNLDKMTKIIGKYVTFCFEHEVRTFNV